ncbi:MAG TPA: hypothetical protein VF787_21635 [Thermoanaerobaculia bacterium]
MSDTLATVTAYRRRDHAGVAQAALDGAGIDSVVEETPVSKVKVEPVDALRAGDVLNQVTAPLDEIGEADEAPRGAACPECGSADVETSRRAILFGAIAAAVIGVAVAIGRTDAAFFILFAAAVYLLIANRWRCGACGHAWD